MRLTRTMALATILAGITGVETAPRAQAHGFGGIHIGGIGGLHLGGIGGFHGGGMHLGGGFHGGGMHIGGGFHGGGMHLGSANIGGGFHGGTAFRGGAAAVSGTRGSSGAGNSVAARSFSSRYSVASTGGKLGSANAAATQAVGSTTTAHSASASSTFLAQHGGATSGAGQDGKSAVVQVNHATSSGAGNGSSNAAAAGKGSSNPSNLGLNGGVLMPSRGLVVGFPWAGNSPLYYGSNGYGNSPYGFSYCGYYDLASSNGAPPNEPSTGLQAVPPALGVTLPNTGETLDFAALGETEFRAGNFQAAMNDWRHAMMDDAKNQVLVLLYGQALFAIGKYDEAAGAVQHALRQMPDDKWGVVVAHYAELYRGNQDYTDQLRALEAASNKHETDSPAVRFLLGYHYGYLGYPKNAVAELDKTLSIVPDDTIAKQLRDIMAAKLPPIDPAAPAAPATK